MSFCLFQVASPCIEPVTTKEKRMSARIFDKHLVESTRERRHVLRILDDRNPFSVQMCTYPMKSLQHFIQSMEAMVNRTGPYGKAYARIFGLDGTRSNVSDRIVGLSGSGS